MLHKNINWYVFIRTTMCHHMLQQEVMCVYPTPNYGRKKLIFLFYSIVWENQNLYDLYYREPPLQRLVDMLYLLSRYIV